MLVILGNKEINCPLTTSTATGLCHVYMIIRYVISEKDYTVQINEN